MNLGNKDPSITSFYFVRHAPVIKKPGCLPAYDPPIVNAPYLIDNLIKELPKNADWHISPLLRTRQTADLLRGRLTPRSEQVTDTLIEQNFGVWNDQKIETVWAEIQSGPRHNWGFLMPDVRPQAGESFDDQVCRITTWCQAIEKQSFTRPQIIFTHAGTIRAVLCHILDIPSVKAQAVAVSHYGYLHVSLMGADHAKNHHGGAWQFHALNPGSH